MYIPKRIIEKKNAKNYYKSEICCGYSLKVLKSFSKNRYRIGMSFLRMWFQEFYF